MTDDIRERVAKAVQKNNDRYPTNNRYQAVREDAFGSYSIWTVEFFDESGNQYTNFAVTRGNAVLKCFYYIGDVIPFLDRRTGMRSLLIDQYGLVVGSFVTIIVLGGVLVALIAGREIPQPLWITLSAAVGYLFGNKTIAKSPNDPN